MIAALGFLAAALSIALVWPQVWLSCRHGRTLGLSPTSAWLGVSLNLCWLTFGLLMRDPAQILTNVFVGASNTAVLAALLITQPDLRSKRVLLRTAPGAAVLAALAAGSAAAVVLLGADPTAAAITLSGIISLVGSAAAIPQPLSLLRNRTQDVSGLSVARWRLGAGSCASWFTYGWLIEQPTVWFTAGFGLCCALVMCALLDSRRAGTSVGPADRRVLVTFPTVRLVCPAHARAVLVAAA